MPILDPVKNTATTFVLPVRDPTCRSRSGPATPARSRSLQPSAYWGEESIWDTQGQQPQLDVRPEGPRVAGRDRPQAGQSGVLQEGLDASVREVVPAQQHQSASIAMFDPKTENTPPIDTCFGTHHLQFGYDANDTLWTSGGGGGCRLAQHQDVRRDRRRREVAGLDGAGARHQRQRQARRVRRARTSRTIRPRTSASTRRSTP